MINPLQLIPGLFGLLNWRAHRRQDAAHSEMLAKLDTIEELCQPEPAFPARTPHYAPARCVSVPRGRLPSGWSAERREREAVHRARVREWGYKLDVADAEANRRREIY
jgi:hypothetical protein